MEQIHQLIQSEQYLATLLDCEDYNVCHMSCDLFFYSTPPHIGMQGFERLECDIRNYPQNSSFVADVGNSVNLSSFLPGIDPQLSQVSSKHFMFVISIIVHLFKLLPVAMLLTYNYKYCIFSYLVDGFCDYNETVTQFGNIIWPETSIGGIASATCGEGRFATQLCLSSGWQDPEYSLCSSGSTNVSCMLQPLHTDLTKIYTHLIFFQ